MDDIFVYFVDMPGEVNEMVTPCLDGYTIYIDRNLSELRQIEAYRHAISRIANNDFEKTDVQEIEYSAHNKTPAH